MFLQSLLFTYCNTKLMTILTLKVLNFWKFTSYCSLKPLWSGMREVVPARTSPTLHPPSPPTVHQLSRLALLRANLHHWPEQKCVQWEKGACAQCCLHQHALQYISLEWETNIMMKHILSMQYQVYISIVRPALMNVYLPLLPALFQYSVQTCGCTVHSDTPSLSKQWNKIMYMYSYVINCGP